MTNDKRVKFHLDKINYICKGLDYVTHRRVQEELSEIARLMKEQKTVEQKVSSTEQRCGNCNKVIEMDGWIACPWCGKLIAWNEWWNKNGEKAVKCE